MVGGFPLTAGSFVVSSPCVAQIDHDPGLELIFNSNDGYLYAYSLPGTYSPQSLVWSMGGSDPGRTCRYHGAGGSPPVAGSGRFLPQGFHLFPNPVNTLVGHSERVTVRYSLQRDCSVKITFYDVTGQEVRAFASAPQRGGFDAHTTLDISDLASGVYLCRVEATSGSESEVHMGKMAIIR